jgi:hypothetical protein
MPSEDAKDITPGPIRNVSRETLPAKHLSWAPGAAVGFELKRTLCSAAPTEDDRAATGDHKASQFLEGQA